MLRTSASESLLITSQPESEAKTRPPRPTQVLYVCLKFIALVGVVGAVSYLSLRRWDSKRGSITRSRCTPRVYDTGHYREQDTGKQGSEANSLQAIHGNEPGRTRWTEPEIVQYMRAHPHRAFFSRLFRDGGFRVGMEVGVAHGRFSEHFLIDNARLEHWTWYMIEPAPPEPLTQRLPMTQDGHLIPEHPNATGPGSWHARGIGSNAHIIFHKRLSLDPQLLVEVPDGSIDFIYLDGAHDYANVKREMFKYWPLVKPGGVLAGHDYCTTQPRLNCPDCERVPRCGVYTELATGPGDKKAGMPVQDQSGVVRAVHEWRAETGLNAALWHTSEDFSKHELQSEQIDYDLVLTYTRNPSWFLVKPGK